MSVYAIGDGSQHNPLEAMQYATALTGVWCAHLESTKRYVVTTVAFCLEPSMLGHFQELCRQTIVSQRWNVPACDSAFAMGLKALEVSERLSDAEWRKRAFPEKYETASHFRDAGVGATCACVGFVRARHDLPRDTYLCQCYLHLETRR